MLHMTATGALIRDSRAPSFWTGVALGGLLQGSGADEGFYGADFATLAGGAGDDTYMVWVTSTSILEEAGGDVDTIDSRVWGETTLPEHVENLHLNGPGATAGTGNGLANILAAGEVGATLDGRGGDDVLIGGAGADIFRIEAGNGSEAIVGFKPGGDVITLIGHGISSFAELASRATQVGSDLWFAFANGEALVLRDTGLAALDGYDFGLDQPAPAWAPGLGTLTGPGACYTASGWYVLNNVWNAGALEYGTDYTIDTVFDTDDLTTGVTFGWSFPLATQAFPPILAYPEVIFGPAPMSGGHKASDTAGFFPLRVGDIHDLTASYDVSYEGNTDWFNVAFDIWLTDTPNGGAGSVTNEVMIWVHQGKVTPSGGVIGTYSDATLSARIHSSDAGNWTYTAVVLDEDRPAGEISISGILDRLEQLGVVSASEYVASVELGAEIVAGAGSLTINELTVTAALEDRTLMSSGGDTVSWLV